MRYALAVSEDDNRYEIIELTADMSPEQEVEARTSLTGFVVILLVGTLSEVTELSHLIDQEEIV